jgi:hypothetical protein
MRNKEPMDCRQLIQAALAEAPATGEVIRLIDLCHKMASACLQAKVCSGRFQPNLAGLSIRDFALDAIAELFARDNAGRFKELRRYFESMGPT